MPSFVVGYSILSKKVALCEYVILQKSCESYCRNEENMVKYKMYKNAIILNGDKFDVKK